MNQASEPCEAYEAYEGDYCFVLPDGVPGDPASTRGRKMKPRRETAGRSHATGVSRSSLRHVAGVNLFPAHDSGQRERMIAEAAYFRAERRGFAPGHEMADWLQAEADVDARANPRP